MPPWVDITLNKRTQEKIKQGIKELSAWHQT